MSCVDGEGAFNCHVRLGAIEIQIHIIVLSMFGNCNLTSMYIS